MEDLVIDNFSEINIELKLNEGEEDGSYIEHDDIHVADKRVSSVVSDNKFADGDKNQTTNITHKETGEQLAEISF